MASKAALTFPVLEPKKKKPKYAPVSKSALAVPLVGKASVAGSAAALLVVVCIAILSGSTVLVLPAFLVGNAAPPPPPGVPVYLLGFTQSFNSTLADFNPSQYTSALSAAFGVSVDRINATVISENPLTVRVVADFEVDVDSLEAGELLVDAWEANSTRASEQVTFQVYQTETSETTPLVYRLYPPAAPPPPPQTPPPASPPPPGAQVLNGHDANCLTYDTATGGVVMAACLGSGDEHQNWYIDDDHLLKTYHDDKCAHYNHSTGHVYMEACDAHLAVQQWSYTSAGELTTNHDDKCATYNTNTSEVFMSSCTSESVQIFTFGQWPHPPPAGPPPPPSGAQVLNGHDTNCLTYDTATGGVVMAACLGSGDEHQKWYIDDDHLLKTYHDDKCAHYNHSTGHVYMEACDTHLAAQQWSYTSTGELTTNHDDKCATYNTNTSKVFMSSCTSESVQIFTFGQWPHPPPAAPPESPPYAQTIEPTCAYSHHIQTTQSEAESGASSPSTSSSWGSSSSLDSSSLESQSLES